MNAPLQLEAITRPVSYVDPVLLFHHLCREQPDCLLLESAEIDSKRHLRSFLLIQSALRLECRGRQVIARALTSGGRCLLRHVAGAATEMFLRERDEERLVLEFPEPASDLDEDERLVAPSVLSPLRWLRDVVQINSTVPQALFVGGLFGYDLVESFEPLPPLEDAGFCPNYVFYVSQAMICLDHQSEQGQLIGSHFYEPYQDSDRAEFESVLAELERRCAGCSLVDLPPAPAVSSDAETEMPDEKFRQVVLDLKREIGRGEVFQAVPSRRFSLPCPAPLRAYRSLRRSNPSPYMFLMQDEQFTLFGASPEMAVKFTAQTREVEVCPIAGTRHRGKNDDGSLNHDLDSRIELELRTDQKEMAEHLMLVDLARNDLARICDPGTRHIAQLLKVDRYSHVMHLVSRLIGLLRPELDALHAYQATMNMGTLTGAPKVRAMQLIRELEGRRRDAYGGGIGYFMGNGDMETCIVIRSALVQNGVAYVQAGAGIVYDSDPQAEADETRSKAQAVLNALAAAHLDEASHMS